MREEKLETIRLSNIMEKVTKFLLGLLVLAIAVPIIIVGGTVLLLVIIPLFLLAVALSPRKKIFHVGRGTVDWRRSPAPRSNQAVGDGGDFIDIDAVEIEPESPVIKSGETG